jgi:hypothetical protein
MHPAQHHSADLSDEEPALVGGGSGEGKVCLQWPLLRVFCGIYQACVGSNGRNDVVCKCVSSGAL